MSRQYQNQSQSSLNPLAVQGYSMERIRPRLIRLLLGEVEGFADQYSRAYDVQIKQETANEIYRRVEQVGFNPNAISSGLFSGSASDFLTPQTQAKRVNIAEGWGTPRFHFLLEVEIVTDLSTKTELIQGFTDHSELSLSGDLDPNMNFTIDSVTTISDVPTTNAHGYSFTGKKLVDASHVLKDHAFSELTNVFDSNNTNSMMVRPMDVFGSISRSKTDLPDDTYALAPMVGGGSHTSRRMNGMSSNYIGRVIGSVASTVNSFGNGMINPSQLYAEAIGKSQEYSIAENHFLKALSNRRGGGMVASFTLGTLHAIDDTLKQRTRTQILQGRALTRVTDDGNFGYGGGMGNYSQESSNWQSQTYTTMAATTLANALPGLGITHGVADLWFNVTNMNNYDINNPVMFVWTAPPTSLTSMPVEHLLNTLRSIIVDDLMAGISKNNQLPYDIRVKCNVFGRTEIDIQIGSERDRFVTPTFASGLMAPVIGEGDQQLNKVAAGFTYLLDDVLQVGRVPTMGNDDISGAWNNTSAFGNPKPTQDNSFGQTLTGGSSRFGI